ncbi:MAG: hypothetical protein IAE92_14110 [Burkholderiaceae bacterium]|nr:hypothetical protein [Burkholderiaceae bacterium]
MNRADAVAQLQQTWEILNADLDAAVKYGRLDNTPYAQRALVRAFFAAVEGLSFQMRQVTLASLAGTEFITEQEVQLLREVRHSLDEKGHPKETPVFLPFPESLLFSLSIYAKNHGAVFEVDKSQQGWQALRQATKVRNNVTHPKTPESLTLTSVDLQALMNASRWWQATLLSLFKACNEADEYWNAKLGDPK